MKNRRHVRLLSPYSPASPWLPSLEVEAKATDGRISYRLQNGRTISADGVRFGDIHIANVDLRAEVRNNLLMVMPFAFSFSDYSLRLLGVNNFNGDLAYHVGLFRSPLHIPFAVNIEGTYSKPEIKFGGKRWKDKRAAEVVSIMQADDRVNLLVEASHYMKSLVHVAATYYQGKYGNLPLKKN